MVRVSGSLSRGRVVGFQQEVPEAFRFARADVLGGGREGVGGGGGGGVFEENPQIGSLQDRFLTLQLSTGNR